MRSKFMLLIFTMIIILFSVPIHALDESGKNGEVLYHQSFSDGLNVSQCGIRIGTAGSQNCSLISSDEGLKIETYDSERAYILLPSFYVSETRTIEFSFRFDKKQTDNARLAVMLTCRGEEPTNITSLVFRAGGTVDGFTEPPDNLKKAITDGMTIGVKIPLDDGVLHEIIMSIGGVEYVLENREVTLVSNGNLGFVVRNADVTLNDIYVVNGVNYSDKTGYYADKSYSDENVQSDSDLHTETSDDDKAPNTGIESDRFLLLLLGLSALGVCSTVKQRFYRVISR